MVGHLWLVFARGVGAGVAKKEGEQRRREDDVEVGSRCLYRGLRSACHERKGQGARARARERETLRSGKSMQMRKEA